ncbi:hypothetical protein SDC9_98953 [bioreactor metagenome]|uniref:Uncharacterized protein n=1 Tax=bioreactor metagenome TaxID=1076179 RepID=A0A645AGQ1_9ZZZZ
MQAESERAPRHTGFGVQFFAAPKMQRPVGRKFKAAPAEKGRSGKLLHFFGIFCALFTVDAIEKDRNKRYNQLVRLKRQNDFFNTSLTLQNRVGNTVRPLPAMRAKAKTRAGGPHKGAPVYLNDTR